MKPTHVAGCGGEAHVRQEETACGTQRWWFYTEVEPEGTSRSVLARVGRCWSMLECVSVSGWITGSCGVVSHPVGVGVDADSAPHFALHPLLMVQTQSVVKVTVGHRRVNGRLWKTNPPQREPDLSSRLRLSSLVLCSFGCVSVCFLHWGLLLSLLTHTSVVTLDTSCDHTGITTATASYQQGAA